MYWHISGEVELELAVEPADLTLLGSVGSEMEVAAGDRPGTSVVPVDQRRYLRSPSLTRDELAAALGKARLIAG